MAHQPSGVNTRAPRRRTSTGESFSTSILNDRRLQLGVLVAGIVGTALIAGALVFSRSQSASYAHRLDRIDTEVAQPLAMLDRTKAGFRQTQRTFDSATSGSTDSLQIASLLAAAVTESQQAETAWEEFDATPVREDGERAARDGASASILRNAEAGQALGVAVLKPVRDPAEVAVLAAAQRITAARVLQDIDEIESVFYVPALGEQITAVERHAADTTDAILLGILAVLAVGTMLTFVGYRRAVRIERQSALDRAQQDQIAAENALDAQLQHALDMADTEEQVFGVIDRALTASTSKVLSVSTSAATSTLASTADFLLSDTSTSGFQHAVMPASPDGHACPVSTPGECPVARHGQGIVFSDSRALDACTYLLDRPIVPTAAVCTPVSIAGLTTGVIHEAHLEPVPFEHHRIRELEIIARKAGDRLGMLRAFERSEAQAHTDPLTGLLNRRSLEAAVQALNRDGVDYTVAFADLDHFKGLNDTYGHDVGDRALRAFCVVLRNSVRPDDVVARYGGEEFVVILPRCQPIEAVPVLQRVQGSLADTVRAEALPTFTVSIGVASTHRGGTFEDILMLADGCLLHAKEMGRNRIMVAGIEEPYIGSSDRAERR